MGDLRIWIKGLLAATIHGGAVAATAAIVDPVAFATSKGALQRLGVVAGMSAILGAAGFLAQSPIPDR